MDQSTLNIAAGAVMGCLGWFARMLWDRQQAHDKELADIRILIAGGYVTNEKLNEVMDGVREDLRYIRGRMDETPLRRAGDSRP